MRKALFPLAGLLREVSAFARAKLRRSEHVAFHVCGLDAISPLWHARGDVNILKQACFRVEGSGSDTHVQGSARPCHGCNSFDSL